jgi:hypothetical protein
MEGPVLIVFMEPMEGPVLIVFMEPMEGPVLIVFMEPIDAPPNNHLSSSSSSSRKPKPAHTDAHAKRNTKVRVNTRILRTRERIRRQTLKANTHSMTTHDAHGKTRTQSHSLSPT